MWGFNFGITLVLDRVMPAFARKPFPPSLPSRMRRPAYTSFSPPQHRTEELNFSGEVSLWMPPRLALYDHLAFKSPQQSPLRRKVLHLDHLGWAEIIAALAHSGTGISPDGLCCIS